MLQRYGSMIAMHQPMECWTKIRLGNLRKTCVLCSFTCDVSQRVACSFAYLLNCTVILFLSYSFQTHRFTHPEIDACASATAIYHPETNFAISSHWESSPPLVIWGSPAIKHGDGTSPRNFSRCLSGNIK